MNFTPWEGLKNLFIMALISLESIVFGDAQIDNDTPNAGSVLSTWGVGEKGFPYNQII